MPHVAVTALALFAPALVAIPIAGPGYAAAETCDGRAATIVVPVVMQWLDPDRTQAVTGTPGDDVIVGTPLADTIDGAGGNDVICGLEGADDLAGGTGDDRLLGGLDGRDRTSPEGNFPLGDHVTPGPGDDFVDLGRDPRFTHVGWSDHEQVRYDDSATGVDVDLTPANGTGRAVGEGTDTIVVNGPMAVVGSPHDDHIIGSPYADAIMAFRGHDSLSGEDGDDLLLPDASEVWDEFGLHPQEDEDHISPDTVLGGAGNDIISSVWGPTKASGGAGDDDVTISSNAIRGNGTADGSRVSGGDGDDRIVAEFVRGLHVSGGQGKDQITHSLFDRPDRTVTLGGAGRDQVLLSTRRTDLSAGTRVAVDRRRSRVQVTRPGRARTVAVMRGYERYSLDGVGIHWTYRGANGKDRVDTVRANSLRALTFGGRDRVEGTPGRDHLDLGGGLDTADGKLRTDTCIDVERAKSCEIRR